MPAATILQLRALQAAALGALACIASAAPAAQETATAIQNRYTLDIPAQNLESALQAVALAVNGKMLYERELLTGKTSARLQGAFTTEEAVRALLAGTNLTYEFTSSSVVLIRQKGAQGPQPSSKQTNLSRTAAELRLASADTATVAPQSAPEKESATNGPQEGEVDSDMIIFGERILTRNREDTVEPVLVYAAGYFERFEPLTLNDMLKRVPGVYFDKLFNLPNVTMSTVPIPDINGTLPRFRNMDAQFSQILVNGRRIAGVDFGSGSDAFLQSIPAESVKEIRVIRSPSAEIDSSGVGMTLDVILKGGSKYSDNSWRAAGSYLDHELEPMGSTNFRGSTDRMTYSLTATAQNRSGSGHVINDTTGDNTISFPGQSLRIQSVSHSTYASKQRDEDRSVIATLGFNVGGTGKLGIETKYVNTGSAGEIHSDGLSRSTSTNRFGNLPPTVTITNTSLLGESETQRDTSNRGLALTYGMSVRSTFTWNAVAGYDRTDLESASTNYGFNTGTRAMSGQALAEGKGQRYQFNHHFSWKPVERHELRFGADWQKVTDSNFISLRNITAFTPPGGTLTVSAEDLQTIKRTDVFGVYEWQITDELSLQVGARNEMADYASNAPPYLLLTQIANVFQFDPNVLSVSRRTRFDADVSGFNPSAHLRWELSDRQTLRFSVAQTVRRPNLNELDPQVRVLAATSLPGRNDVSVGNPTLANEEAQGLDVGYDWRFTDGIIGVNVFGRRIENLIQMSTVSAATFAQLRPDVAPEINRFALFMAQNYPIAPPLTYTTYLSTTNEAKVHGVELDMSFPLHFISHNAHLYANATWSKRRIASQPAVEASAVNFAYDHLIEPLGITYGTSLNWITRDRTHTEIVNSSVSDRVRELEPNIEVFVEKKFTRSLLARLTVENLTDAVDDVDSSTVGTGVLPGSVTGHLITQSDPRILFTVRGKF